MLLSNKHNFIRTIYLYLFTIIGLSLLILGSVGLIDLGLKMFVFTKAEEAEIIQQMYFYPKVDYFFISKLETYREANEEDLTLEEKENLKNFLLDYQDWKEKESKVDYLRSNREKKAANNLAMILVGLPLYLYHWQTIKKEIKEEKNKN